MGGCLIYRRVRITHIKCDIYSGVVIVARSWIMVNRCAQVARYSLRVATLGHETAAPQTSRGQIGTATG